MPFQRPALPTLINRAAADVASRLPGADAQLRRSVLGVLVRAHAGAAHGLYGFLDWLALQLMPDTAESAHLERHSSIWNITRKLAAAASGSITFTGTTGAIVPAGTLLARADGIDYTTDADATLVAGVATTAVTASKPGAIGNMDAGGALTIVAPVAGVNAAVIVASGGLTQGTDIEADDALRARLLTRIQQPPQGGAAHDYEAWALSVPGITRAWVAPLEMGPGTVTIRVVRDNDPSIIPDAAELQAVQDFIDGVRPVTAEVFVVAPIPVALNFTIQITPATQAVRDAITAEIADLLRREAAPGATILLSHMREAISIAAGETDHVLTVPAANITHAAGEMAVMGVITWL